MDFGEAIELGRDCTGRVELFVFLGGKASCLLNVFEKVDKFVFEVGRWGPWGVLYRCWCPVVRLVFCLCSPVGP